MLRITMFMVIPKGLLLTYELIIMPTNITKANIHVEFVRNMAIISGSRWSLETG